MNTTTFCLALAFALPLIACGENASAAPTLTSSTMLRAEILLRHASDHVAAASRSIAELDTKAAGLTGDTKAKVEGMITKIKARQAEVARLISECQTSPLGTSLDNSVDKTVGATTELMKMISEALAAAN